MIILNSMLKYYGEKFCLEKMWESLVEQWTDPMGIRPAYVTSTYFEVFH